MFTLNEVKSIAKEQLYNLIENKVPESKVLDYKANLKYASYNEKKELLADISSFSNSEGGNIIWGLKESKGVPNEIVGVELDNPDEAILKIENLIRDCTEPRIQGLLIKTINLGENNYVVIAHIPKSLNPPHVIKIDKHWRFYSRNSAGKYPLELSELKSIIATSEVVKQKIMNFRIERISQIKNSNLQIPLFDGPKFILHLIPLSAFSTESSIEINKFEHGAVRYDLFHDLYKIFNYEGFLIHNHAQQYPADWYMQIFRNGIMEICNIRLHIDNGKLLYRNAFEKKVADDTLKYINMMKTFNIYPPYLVFLSVLDVKGFKMELCEHERMRAMYNNPIVKDDLLLPDVFLSEENMDNLFLVLKPIYDQIWNACGFPGSPNYDQENNWIGDKE